MPTGMSRFVHARAGMSALVVTGALFAAACSGSSGNAAPASTASSAGPPSSAAFQAYRDCLSQHGVTLPTRPRNQSDSSASPDSGSDQSGQGRGGGAGGGVYGHLSL